MLGFVFPSHAADSTITAAAPTVRMASPVSVSSDESAEVPRSIVPVVTPAPPPVVEKDLPINPAAGAADEGSKVVRSVVRRWKREDLLEKAGLLLRALAWVFSLVAVAVLASNKQGGWMNFDRYQEYRCARSVFEVRVDAFGCVWLWD